jgi:uncharacterized membrane protein YdjX (TVP38/TMEM64 family)
MPDHPDNPRPRLSVRKWWPLGGLILISVLVVALGWHRHVSIETLVRHYNSIHAFVLANPAASLAAYVATYVVVVMLSLPGALAMTLTGGILFGGALGGVAAIVGATAGATLVFLLARSAFGESLARRAGPFVGKLAAGFRANAFHYLLFLRLVPVFPFFVVNLVPALAGVPLATFVAATAIGIVPGGFAFAFAGAGLDSVIRTQAAAYKACLDAARGNCHLDFDIKAAVTPELLLGLAALGAIALLPVILRRWRGGRLADSSG